MISPFSLSLINLILIISLGTGLLILKFIYPKNNINLLVLLILVSLLPTWSIFRPGSYESGDMTLHTIRAISFFKSLSQGIFVPGWAGELNATYGYPLFEFIYLLPYYLISFFHLIGFSFVTATKLILASSFIISGLTMYLWIKDELNEKAAFIASVFYLFVPYHLIDMHFRSDIGEMVCFALLPISLYLAKKFIEKPSRFLLVIQACFFALIILSHPAISIGSLPLLSIYSAFCWLRLKKRTTKILSANYLSLGMGIILSSFYWLPTIINLKFTHPASGVSFPNLLEFIYSPWRFGLLFQGHYGELSFILGYVQLAVLIFITYKVITKKWTWKKQSLAILFFALFLGYFFMMQHISAPLWQIIPFIKNFQFTYRLLLFTSIFTSVLAAFILYKIKNNWLLVMVLTITIGYTLLNWGNRGMVTKINDTYLINNLPLSSANIEGLIPASPIWTDQKNPWMKTIPKNHLEVISGQADIKQVSIITNYHEYAVSVTKNTTFKENTLYFPGWNLYLNNKLYPIEISKTYPKGVIEFKLPKGLYDVQLKFENYKFY